MTWLTLMGLRKLLTPRVGLIMFVVTVLVWLTYRHVVHDREAVASARKAGADSVAAEAAQRGAEYAGAIGVLAAQLREAKAQLSTATARVDVQLPKAKRALAAVTPAERDSSPVAVQVALAEADSLIPLLEEFRVQVQTVTSAAAAVHTLDSTALHAAHVVIGTVTFQRDSAITASEKKISKTTAGVIFVLEGIAMYFLGKATK